jgi:hypothetical protein
VLFRVGLRVFYTQSVWHQKTILSTRIEQWQRIELAGVVNIDRPETSS